jgi:hypothetical protein
MGVKLMKNTTFILFLLLLISVQDSFGWFDKTHIAVAKAAEYDRWYNAAGPDIARIKAGKIEDYNHYYNNNRNITITPEITLKQAEKYNNPRDKNGHLYGAIIGSLREYVKISGSGGFADPHFDFFVHYAADLSQPFHNIPYDNFKKSRHLINDGIVNREVLDNISGITSHMYKIDLQKGNLEYAVAKEVARLANQARRLGDKLKKEARNMTKEEVYVQLGHSASLISAVIIQLEK